MLPAPITRQVSIPNLHTCEISLATRSTVETSIHMNQHPLEILQIFLEELFLI